MFKIISKSSSTFIKFLLLKHLEIRANFIGVIEVSKVGL